AARAGVGHDDRGRALVRALGLVDLHLSGACDFADRARRESARRQPRGPPRSRPARGARAMSAVRATGAMSAAAASTASDLALERLSVEVQSGGRALRVVDDVSLVVRRGETLGLVGESGSGKSTVANAILRVLPRRARARITGRIALGATELTALPEREMRAVRGRRIAMIPQDPMSSLNPLYTIGAQIAEALAAHG